MKLPSTEIKKIAVFRALQLGDMLCAVPAFRALRSAYPQAEITLLGLPWADNFVKRFSLYFDKFIHFPGFAGLPEQPFDRAVYQEFVQKIQEEKFDVLLQMQGNGTIVNPLMFKWGAKHVAGFCNKESYVNSELFMEYPDDGPEPRRHIQLMEHLGIPAKGDYLEYPLYDNDFKDFQDLQLPILSRQYVCVHPGSRGRWRQWPPIYFAALADYCVQHHFAVIITGTAEEAAITESVIKNMQFPAINCTGKTSMGAIGALIKNAFLLISNCTGVSHIAAAFKTPSIVISMDGEPERWAPINRTVHKVTDWTKEADFDKVMNDLKDLIEQKNDERE